MPGASQYTALRITRGRSSAAGVARGSLLIEQEAWSPYVAKLTKGGAVAYLQALLFGEPEDAPPSNCGIGPDGRITAEVYTYPDPPDLLYRVAATHGSVGLGAVEDLKYTEVVQVQGERTPALRYPTRSITSAEWVRDAYTRLGVTVPVNPVFIADGRVTLDAAGLYGTMLVTYQVRRRRHTVTIPPRTDDPDNRFKSFVYAIWDGGNAVAEFKLPADAEDSQTSAAGGRCNTDYLSALGNGYGIAGLQIADDDDPPVAKPEDINYTIDYCSGAVR